MFTKKMRKATAITLTVLMVMMLLPTFSLFALSDSNYAIAKRQVVGDKYEVLPGALSEGQIWTGKEVTYNENDFTFTVTLSAWGAKFDGNDPLVNGSSVTVSDEIGTDFTFISSPDGLSAAGGKVTWIVPQSAILGTAPASASFTVKLNDASRNTGVWYPTGLAEARFAPIQGNPYYWVTEKKEKVSLEIDGINWNNGTQSGINQIGKFIDFDLNINVSKVPSNENLVITSLADNSKRTFTFDSSRRNENYIAAFDADGMLILPANMAGAKDGFCGTLWNKGGKENKTYYIWFMGLVAPGVLTVYDVTPGNNGGAGGEGGTRFTFYNEYFHNNEFTWDGDDVLTALPVKGEIKLEIIAVPATIEFKKNIAGNSTGSFTFELSVDNKVIATTTKGAGLHSITLENVLDLLDGAESKIFTLKEAPGGGIGHGLWANDATSHQIRIDDKGLVTYLSLSEGQVIPVFTNTFSPYFNITVNYYVNGIPQTGKSVVIENKVSGYNYYGDVQGLILPVFGEEEAVFGFGTSSEVSGAAAGVENAKSILANRSIDNKDVVINLYYTDWSDLDVQLFKSIEGLFGDEDKLPESFAFTFILHNGVKDVASLTLTDADFADGEAEGTFVWDKGVDFYRDLSGKTLTISESISSDYAGSWASCLTDGSDYVAIGEHGGVDYLMGSEYLIVNTFDQDKQETAIILHKYFAGDLETFVYQGSDNTEEQPICGIDGHDHDEDCYDYLYEFSFQLFGRGRVLLGEQSIQLTRSQIETLVNSNAYEEFIFPIAIADLAKGPFSIRETASADYIGWTLGSTVRGIQINRLGTQVTYPGQKAQAEMTNTFGGNTRPEFSFGKEVIDARTGRVADYDGAFTFELWDGSSFLGTYVIDVTAGQGVSEIIALDGYINADATLTLVEVYGDNDPVYGMEYDTNTITIEIRGGVVVSEEDFQFTNTYLEPITPAFRVAKVTNKGRYNGTFTFSYSYMDGNEPFSGAVDVTTHRGRGISEPIWLPENFSGDVTVTELAGPEGVEGWVLDKSAKTLSFTLGVNQGVSVAPFTNNFYAPAISLDKNNNQGENNVIVNWTEVSYTLTVTNSGTEDLVGVEVTDSMFAALGSDPAFGITLITSEGSRELEAGEYAYEAETLTFSELKVGEQIVISYSIVPETVGELRNEAYAGANGKNTDIGVNDEDDSTITVLDQEPVRPAVEKLVAEGEYDPENDEDVSWQPKAIVNDRAMVTFKIILSAAGYDYSPQVATFNFSDVFAGKALDLLGGETTVTLAKNEDNTYGPVTLYYTEQVRNFSDKAISLKNTATLGDKSDSAVVEVKPYVPGLDVAKGAAAYTAAGLPQEGANLDGYDYKSTVSFNASGSRAIFEITITNNTGGELLITGIKDIFGTIDLAGATFYLANGAATALADILGEGGMTLAAGESFSFYYVTEPQTLRGTFVNTVTVNATDGGEALEPVTASASVSVSWTSTITTPDPDPDPTPVTPDPDPTPVVNIPDMVAPLASFPEITVPEEEEFVIMDEDIPLGNLPQTGSAASAGAGLFGLFTALSGLAAASATLLKKEEE